MSMRSRMLLRLVGLVFMMSWSFHLAAQIGGRSTYNFLKLTPSARVTALGGMAIATHDQDVNLAFFNPAMLEASMDKKIGTNLVNYIADINYGNVNYVHHLNDKWGTLGGGITYVNYGRFDQTDAAGNVTGEFSANELAAQLSWGMAINPMMRTGATLKYVGSFLEGYQSHGMAIDLATMYIDTANRTVISLLIRNFGTQISTYEQMGNRAALPLDVQLGFTNRLKYVPFRWGITFHNLHHWRLRYYDDADLYYRQRVLLNEDENQPEQGNAVLDEFFRHVVLNGELLFSKNFHFRFGYNHQRRKELLIPMRYGGSGFSWGFGIQVKRFRFDYGRGALTLAGATNNFSITTNLSDW